MNWGVKIAAMYSGFAAMIIFMVILAMQHKVELVSPDYYKQELAYESRISSMKNYNTLSDEVIIANEADKIVINFPAQFKNQTIEGTINFAKPDDSSKDLLLKITTSNNSQTVSKSLLGKGLYKIEIEWKSDNKTYYKEIKLFN